MSSADADIDVGVPMPRALAEATARLADFEIYGLVWLTRSLEVEKTFGSLVDFVEHDKPITSSIVALIGLEGDIAALRATPERLMELPAIAVATDEGGSRRRLNFTIFWLPDEDRPMLLAYRANSQTDLELELSRQIRAKLMTEADLAEKSRQLARANADLESFAAVVSHDLKAPLRHMRMLADDLIVDSGVNVDAAAAAKLAQLQALSRRMSHMLTELFDYASLGRKYEAIAPVDTLAIARSIVESLPRSNFTFDILGTWPAISTLAAPLDLVLRNLVQNALHHHDRLEGHITLECSEEPASYAFLVGDDGPGIAPQHHDAIFLPFRTLDQRATGTGMGLAMVKKTVDTAGGQIEIDSDPAKARGTRFIVHWPKLIRA